MMFLDTNILLRHLLQDDPEKAQRCFELLQQAEQGEIRLTTSESVIGELVYVLSSPRLYNLPPERIRALLVPIINLRGLRVPTRRLYRRALDLYAAHHIDFEDALNLAHMEKQGIRVILSYDRHYDRIPGITRLEP